MPKIEYSYAQPSIAIEKLRQQGFTVDFNLSENCIVCGSDSYQPDQFEILQVFRYDGNTDPGDETIVYGIESSDGKKGVLLTAFGVYSDSMSAAMLQKVSLRSS